jgi:hypothetical protein
LGRHRIASSGEAWCSSEVQVDKIITKRQFANLKVTGVESCRVVTITN